MISNPNEGKVLLFVKFVNISAYICTKIEHLSCS